MDKGTPNVQTENQDTGSPPISCRLGQAGRPIFSQENLNACENTSSQSSDV